MIMKVKLYNRRHFALVVMAVLVPLLATACSGGTSALDLEPVEAAGPSSNTPNVAFTHPSQLKHCRTLSI